MTASMRWRNACLSLMLLPPLVCCAIPAPAQIGGLIKKRIDKVTSKTPVPQVKGDTVVFNDVVLEITPERIDKLLAAKRAARRIAGGPDGPAAVEKQMEALDASQAAIYAKQVDAINAWDQKRRDYENCVDSVLREASTRHQAEMRSRAVSDPAFVRKLMDLGQAMQAAQQKGDTATVRKIVAEMDGMKALTKADSAEATKHCTYPTPPPLVKEWVGLKQQLDSLDKRRLDAEVLVAREEARLSGMNPRQIAVFCERIKLLIDRIRNKKDHLGFSDSERKTYANYEQAIADLEAICP
jgi:hypothetical protein